MGMAGLSHRLIRPLPCSTGTDQLSRKLSCNRSFEVTAIFRCAKVRSSNGYCVAAPYTR